LVEVLYLWLANLMASTEIKKLAPNPSLDMSNTDTFHTLFAELFDLNMWIVMLGSARLW
jgi:hypothetical protein